MGKGRWKHKIVDVSSEWASAGQCSLEINIDRGNIRGCAYKNSKDNILYFRAENLYFKYDQLARDRKTVYGYVIKKFHNKRYF